MKILLTGAAGQLGQTLRQQLPAEVELISTSRSGDAGGADGGLLPLDLADAAACRAAVLEHRSDWVLNGGAPDDLSDVLGDREERDLLVRQVQQLEQELDHWVGKHEQLIDMATRVTCVLERARRLLDAQSGLRAS